jgi:hypothetical protein
LVPQSSDLYVLSSFQGFGNTGNLHGLPIRAAVADGGTSSSSTISRRLALTAPRNKSRVIFKYCGTCGRARKVCHVPLTHLGVFHLFVFLLTRESEYQLVAGGEELFQENGLLAHKSVPTRMAPSGVRVKEELKETQSPFSRRSPSDGGDFPSDGEGTDLDALRALGLPNERTPGMHLVTTMPFGQLSQQPRSLVKDEVCDLHLPFSSSIPPISSFMAPSVSAPHVVRNSITAVSLGAIGMPLLPVEVDRYAPPSSSLPNYPPRVSIHFKLSLSSLHDVSSPPALHGFSGTVTFAAPWTSVAQCVTRVYAGGVCESEEYAYFDPITPLSPISMTPVTVQLPESELSRCRWGNIGTLRSQRGFTAIKGFTSLLTRAL